jgi:low temperature requirement protein LtrA
MWAVSEHLAGSERRVTPLELFFDLVFVFGFTQVTTLLYEQSTWLGLARALLVLCVLWWGWAAYAWLTNTIDPNAGPVLGSMLVATGAMFLAALAVPEAFTGHRLLFAISFTVVLSMFELLFAFAARGEPELYGAVLRAAPWPLSGALLIIAAAFASSGARPWLWLAAVLAGVAGPAFGRMDGWRVHPAHFAERHGLIVIIATGESLVAIGVGARDTPLGLGVGVAVLLGLVVATSLWLAYFDFFAITMERLLGRLKGREQVILARDAYSYLHLPMIAGIILFAFAVRVVVAHVHRTLDTIPALALCFGSCLYLLAYLGLQWRITRRLTRGRTAATLAFALLAPVALHVSALAALALCAAVWLALHGYELIWWREARAQRRSGHVPEVDVRNLPSGT